MTRVVITHPEMGIYLGTFLGLGTWSLLDPAGQDAAVSFAGENVAADVIRTWERNGDPAAYTFVPVAGDGPWVDIPELQAAGLGDLLGEMQAEAARVEAPS